MTNIVFIEGKVMYARVFENNRDMEGYEGAYREFDGMYELLLGVPTNGDDYKEIMSWNRLYEPKHFGDPGFDEERGAVEGLSYFRFKRRHKHVIASGKEIPEWGGPPKVVAADGTTPWGTDVLIGNGSDVTVKLNVYRADKKRTFVRLEGLRVDNLVEAPKKENDDKVDSPNITSDEIPF